MAVVGALGLAGCSTEVGFPAVHDMPAARTETTLTPDQVKQATDSLISQRDQLQTTAQPVQAAGAPAASPQRNVAAAPAKPAASNPKATAVASPDDATGATAIGAYAKP